MRKITIYYYLTFNRTNPVKEFLDSLLARQQAKILRIFQNAEEYGLEAILPHVKKLAGTPLWEIRVLGRDSIRVIYAILDKNTLLVLHGFIKKSPKTPKKEIKTALDRYYDWRDRS